VSKYELDDDLVRRVLTGRTTGTEQDALFFKLEAQLPIGAPTKIGAVVQTDSKLCAPDLSVFLRWASDEQTGHPWILREELDLKPYSTEEIGRIVKVLSEGVDL
jgi:hypothetical protein